MVILKNFSDTGRCPCGQIVAGAGGYFEIYKPLQCKGIGVFELAQPRGRGLLTFKTHEFTPHVAWPPRRPQASRSGDRSRSPPRSADSIELNFPRGVITAIMTQRHQERERGRDIERERERERDSTSLHNWRLTKRGCAHFSPFDCFEAIRASTSSGFNCA